MENPSTLITDYESSKSEEKWGHSNVIAIIPIVGVITSGESTGSNFLTGEMTAGSETIVRQLNEARKSSAVKGVVLRVDSPGGSAFASEEIWRAIEKLKRQRSPLLGAWAISLHQVDIWLVLEQQLSLQSPRPSQALSGSMPVSLIPKS